MEFIDKVHLMKYHGNDIIATVFRHEGIYKAISLLK